MMQDNAAIFLFRNVPDDVLEMVRDNDGIVMVIFYSCYLVRHHVALWILLIFFMANIIELIGI